jgi:gamma-glutamylcyclotransferase (GGCT)/AIG2-like uncharacterized protein YtfP
MSAPTRIFVYGTLLAGEPNHRLLQGSRFVGRATTEPGYRLHDLGAYPAMVQAGEGTVEGELYEIDAPTLAALDRLEGHPRFYRRVPVTLDGGEAVETYVMAAERVAGRRVLEGGRWRSQ